MLLLQASFHYVSGYLSFVKNFQDKLGFLLRLRDQEWQFLYILEHTCIFSL